MSTEALPWADIDSPWRRLPWTLPLALLICAAVFVWFAYSMHHAAVRAPEAPPVDAEIIELPPPEPPKVQPQPRPQPPVQKAPPVARPQMPAPAPPPVATVTAPATPAPNAPPAPAPLVAAPAPALRARAPTGHAAPSASNGAQALFNPYPVIPDELRVDAMSETATARFHIAADGSFTVELVKPTQNLRLNRLLLDTLKRWKFFPAMREGRPVASEQDVVINTQVK